MLDQMPVAEVSLNQLSRRVGLAKSNVLRYAESREAVLLELLDDFLGRCSLNWRRNSPWASRRTRHRRCGRASWPRC